MLNAEITRRIELGPVPLLQPDEPALGLLEIGVGRERRAFRLGASLLQRGLLIGRYPRCEINETHGFDARVSRVHALALWLDGGVYLMDVGSTNGTAGGRRMTLLLPGNAADIAGVPLVWTPATEV